MEDNQAKILYNKGVQYNSEGVYKLAISNFLKSLEIDPNSIETHFDLGVAYINNKEYDLALESFNTVLKLNQDEVCAYSNIALAYLRKGDFQQSIEYYNKVLSYKPEDLDTFIDLAYAYVKNKQYDEAIELYNKALKHGSHRFKAQEGLNTALNLKNSQEEKVNKEQLDESLKDFFKKPEKTPEHYFNLAVNYVKERNLDLAIEALRSCLKIKPYYPQASQLLDKLFKIKEQTPVNKIVNYKDLTDCFNLGVCFFNAQNYQLALDKFKECIQIDPNHRGTIEYLKKIKEQLAE